MRLGTLWLHHGLRCLLYRGQGTLELRLYGQNGTLLRQMAVGDLDDAEELGSQWLHAAFGVGGASAVTTSKS